MRFTFCGWHHSALCSRSREAKGPNGARGSNKRIFRMDVDRRLWASKLSLGFSYGVVSPALILRGVLPFRLQTLGMNGAARGCRFPHPCRQRSPPQASAWYKGLRRHGWGGSWPCRPMPEDRTREGNFYQLTGAMKFSPLLPPRASGDEKWRPF